MRARHGLARGGGGEECKNAACPWNDKSHVRRCTRGYWRKESRGGYCGVAMRERVVSRGERGVIFRRDENARSEIAELGETVFMARFSLAGEEIKRRSDRSYLNLPLLPTVSPPLRHTSLARADAAGSWNKETRAEG